MTRRKPPLTLRRVAETIHLWLGLLCALPFLFMGLTGSTLVLQDTLRAWGDPPGVTGTPQPVSAILQAAEAAAPGLVPMVYLAPQAPGALASVRLGAAGHARRGGPMVLVKIDPVSLHIQPPSRIDAFLGPLLQLHSTWLMPGSSRVATGCFGVTMLVLGLSGIVNWWPRPGRWRQAFTVAKGARGIRLFRDLHGAIGIWMSVLFLVVVFGGVNLAFPETLRAIVHTVLPGAELPPVPTVKPIPDADPMPIDDAVRLAEAAAPDDRLGAVFLSGRPNQALRISLLRDGQSRLAPTFTVTIDPWRRQVLRIQDPRALSAGDTLLAWQHAIHSGQGLGLLWQSLVFLTGLSPSFFAVTGIGLWVLKRRQRRPSPTLSASPLPRSTTS
jgi:uncharacterized iron-regulated membrane protein